MKMMDLNKYSLFSGCLLGFTRFHEIGVDLISQRVRATSEAGNGAAKTCRHLYVRM
jgi:hypothetical protein